MRLLLRNMPSCRILGLVAVESGVYPDRCKAGLAKVMDCRRKAKEDGYKYVWIDTCCIDKSSSAELSEAINSMFAIYERAAVCYAHLADVHGPSDLTFSTSRWFRRGWTLQELIAPSNLQFFTSTWELIGSKYDMTQAIQEITGIERATLLRVEQVNALSHATVMSYAAKRETTRAEDMAYCLMGLFEIHMPVIYGEGGEKAFIRLQHEILARSPKHSLMAWNSNSNFNASRFCTTSKVNSYLAPSPNHFTLTKVADIPSSDFARTWKADDTDAMCFQTVPRGIRARLPVFVFPNPSGAEPALVFAVIACKAIDPSYQWQYTIAIPLRPIGDDLYVRDHRCPFVSVHSLIELNMSWQHRIVTLVNRDLPSLTKPYRIRNCLALNIKRNPPMITLSSEFPEQGCLEEFITDVASFKGLTVEPCESNTTKVCSNLQLHTQRL